MAKRKQYSEAFKLQAVQQWQESGKSAAEVAKDLDISTSSLYTWRDQFADELASADESAFTDEVAEAAAEPEAVEEREPAVEDAAAKDAESSSAEPEEPQAVEETEEVAEELARVKDETLAEEVAVAAVAAKDVTEAEEEPAKKGGAKAIIKRILGGIAAVLGGLGLLLSIALIIVTWVVNKPVTDGAVEIVSKVEVGLTVANTGLGQADETLSNIRQQIRELTEAVPLEGLQQTITDIQALVDGIKSAVDTAASVVGLADTFPVSLLRGDAEPVDTPKLNEASNTLGEISVGLGQVNDVLVQRQESGLGPVGTEVDNEINDFQVLIQDVNQGVEEGISTTIQLQEDLPGIIDTIAIVLSLLFLWLGVAQYALLVNGWHWVRWP